MPPRPVLIVANRLPVTLTIASDGALTFTVSSGGLVSALVCVRSGKPSSGATAEPSSGATAGVGPTAGTNWLWVGWLGRDVPLADQPTVRARLLAEHGCVPVFLPEALAQKYYAGFSNDLLWPLLHHNYDITGANPFPWSLWQAYQEANALFSAVVLDTISSWAEAPLIWVHDYHLCCLPELLCQARSALTVAWFCHTPWPCSEAWECLPVARLLVRSLLACKLLGFHSYAYACHFLDAVAKLPRAHLLPSSVVHEGLITSVQVFPIGIEAASFQESTPAVLERVDELSREFRGDAGISCKVIVSIGECMVGIPQLPSLLLPIASSGSALVVHALLRVSPHPHRPPGPNQRPTQQATRCCILFSSVAMLDRPLSLHPGRGALSRERGGISNAGDVCGAAGGRDQRQAGHARLAPCAYLLPAPLHLPD